MLGQYTRRSWRSHRRASADSILAIRGLLRNLRMITTSQLNKNLKRAIRDGQKGFWPLMSRLRRKNTECVSGRVAWARWIASPTVSNARDIELSAIEVKSLATVPTRLARRALYPEFVNISRQASIRRTDTITLDRLRTTIVKFQP